MLFRSFESFSLPFVVHDVLFESVTKPLNNSHLDHLAHLQMLYLPLCQKIMQFIAKCI